MVRHSLKFTGWDTSYPGLEQVFCLSVSGHEPRPSSRQLPASAKVFCRKQAAPVLIQQDRKALFSRLNVCSLDLENSTHKKMWHSQGDH